MGEAGKKRFTYGDGLWQRFFKRYDPSEISVVITNQIIIFQNKLNLRSVYPNPQKDNIRNEPNYSSGFVLTFTRETNRHMSTVVFIYEYIKS